MPRICLLFLLCITTFLCPAVYAQDASGGASAETAASNSPVPEQRQSPRAAMFGFLEAMNAIESGETSRWPEVYGLLGYADPEPSDINALRRKAFNLKQTLDYIGEVAEDELPAKTSAESNYFVYFPQVFNDNHQQAVEDIGRDDLTIPLSRDENGWYFMVFTEEFDQLHDLLLEHRTRQYDQLNKNTDGSTIARLMPDALKSGELFGVFYWQWLTLGLLILLAVVIDHTLRTILRGVVRRRVKSSGGQAEVDEINRTVRPFGLLFGGIVVMFGLSLIGLPDLAYRFLFGAAAIFTVLAGVLAAWQMIDLISRIAENHAKKSKTKFDDVLIPMLRKAAKIFVFAMGIIYAAQALSLPVMPLLGSLGIGSLAFAFAAKDTVENFFGSIAVILDRPFEVGDWVVIDGSTEGTVEELGFRSTRIRTFYNSQITVPNATLVRATVDNYGRRTYRRWKTHIGVQYDTPPHLLIAFTEGIRELVRTHPYTRKDYYQIWMHQWSASSMDVLLYVFFEVPDWNTELRERERLFIDIVRLADKLGVSFAFPTQTVHLYKEEHPPEGEKYQPAHDTPGGSTDRRSMVTGARAAQDLIKQQPWLNNRPGPVVFQKGMTPLNLDEAGNATLKDEDQADKTDEPRT